MRCSWGEQSSKKRRMRSSDGCTPTGRILTRDRGPPQHGARNREPPPDGNFPTGSPAAESGASALHVVSDSPTRRYLVRSRDPVRRSPVRGPPGPPRRQTVHHSTLSDWLDACCRTDLKGDRNEISSIDPLSPECSSRRLRRRVGGCWRLARHENTASLTPLRPPGGPHARSPA